MLYATEMTGRRGRGRSVSLYSLASRAGSLIGALLGGWLSQALGIPGMLQIGGLVAFFVGVWAYRRLPESRGVSESEG
jgi:MFS family permease